MGCLVSWRVSSLAACACLAPVVLVFTLFVCDHSAGCHVLLVKLEFMLMMGFCWCQRAPHVHMPRRIWVQVPCTCDGDDGITASACRLTVDQFATPARVLGMLVNLYLLIFNLRAPIWCQGESQKRPLKEGGPTVSFDLKKELVQEKK